MRLFRYLPALFLLALLYGCGPSQETVQQDAGSASSSAPQVDKQQLSALRNQVKRSKGGE